jgi:integrase/recombinase XerC
MNKTELLASLPKLPRIELSPRSVVSSFLQRSKNTARAYEGDLEDFATFLGLDTTEQAATFLFAQEQGHANALVISYFDHLKEQKKSASTINRRLACLKALVARAQLVGLVNFDLKIPKMTAQPYRDTRGPGKEGFLKMLDVLKNRTDAKALRDRAILRLLFDLALRRNEVVTLDRENIDLEAGNLRILGKGKHQTQVMTLAAPTKEALQAWLKLRGEEDGALFRGFDPGQIAERLTGQGLYVIIKAIGKQAGLNVRPHGLRHAAITHALEKTNGNVRKVQKFSRHADVKTLCIYDDARTDEAGEVSSLVSE